MSRPQQKRRSGFDPFRVLALLGIVLGMSIVVAGFAIWFFTGRESSLIIGAGLVMATGGGLREATENVLARLPQSYREPPDDEDYPPEHPHSNPPPPRPPRRNEHHEQV